jgi:two-component system, LytTR family, response regulator LytT
MTCLIVDDQPDALKILEYYCTQAELFTDIISMDHPVKAFSFLQNNKVDLLFLDIHMPELSGIDLMKSLQIPVNVIFTTSDSSYASEAFEFNAIDYLVKPIPYPRFLKSVNRAVQYMSLKSKLAHTTKDFDALFLKDGSKLVKVPLNEILFIEAQGDYVSFRTPKKTFLLHATLKHVEGKLPDTKFFKAHRSYIVNIDRIRDIDETSIHLDDVQIPLSKAKREQLIQRINVI